MAKLRLLIKRPGRATPCIPVIVEENERIGACISWLVNHLGFPRHDTLGRAIPYTLRPLSGGPPLTSTMRFADARLRPGTRLVVEASEASATTLPLGPSLAGTPLAQGPAAEPLPSSFRQGVSRRTFVVGGLLAGCAVGGLFAGMATALATGRRSLPQAMTSPARAIPPAPPAPPATPSPSPPAVLQPVRLFSGHQQTVRAVAWSPDGRMIASGADDGWLLLWTPDGQVQQRIAHPASIAALAWEPSGALLASGAGTRVRFFEGRTAAPLAPARSVHSRPITSLAWSHAKGNPLISGSLDQRAIVWDTRQYRPQAVFARHTAPINALSCQPGSPAIASASQGGVVRVWQVNTLQEVHSLYQDAPLPVQAVAFAPMGNSLAVGGSDGQTRFWNNGLVCQQSTVTAQESLCRDGPLRLRANQSGVRALAWSPDARWLATGSEDGTLALWDCAQSGTAPLLMLAKTLSPRPLAALAWSPVHEQLAVAAGTTVTIWKHHSEGRTLTHR